MHELNIVKAQQMDVLHEDKVRVDDTSLFKQGTESPWSHDTVSQSEVCDIN